MAVPSTSAALHLSGNLAFFAGGLSVDFLTGVFLKSVTEAGLVTVQDANGVEQTVQLDLVAGTAVTANALAPVDADGSNGDLHFQVLSGVIQSVWHRSGGTWNEFTLFADGTVLNGNGAPAGNSGKNGDTYRDDETGSWYKKASGAWTSALYTPSPSGISVAADFPATADAEAGVLYGDGTPIPDIIGYLKRIGETHESTFRTAFLGRGFYGFADAGRDFGSTKYRAGGEVSPRPGGLLAVAFHVSSQTRNTMFVDVSTSSGLFHPEMTSLEIVITQEDSTVQTYLLDQVSTPQTGVRRFLASVTVPSGGMLYEAGEHNKISVKLSAFATPIDLHGGTDVVEVVDEFSIEAQRAEIHREIADVDERVEENEEDIADLQGRHSENLSPSICRSRKVMTRPITRPSVVRVTSGRLIETVGYLASLIGWRRV